MRRPFWKGQRLSTAPSLGILGAALAIWLISTRASAAAQPAGIAQRVDPSHIWITSVGLLAAIILSALYVGAENALDLLRPMHVKFSREKSAQRAEKLE